MLLIKKQGGCTIGDYTWENDGDAVDVSYEFALEVLAIKGHDFSVPDEQGEVSEIDPAAELSESPPRGKSGQFTKAVQEEDGTEETSSR